MKQHWHIATATIDLMLDPPVDFGQGKWSPTFIEEDLRQTVYKEELEGGRVRLAYAAPSYEEAIESVVKAAYIELERLKSV